MLQRLFFSTITLFLIFMTQNIMSEEAPQLKLYSVPYNASKTQCQKDIKVAIKDMSYIYQDKESADGTAVGISGNYKAIVSCINTNNSCSDTTEVDHIVIAVTGSGLETVGAKATALVDVFYLP